MYSAPQGFPGGSVKKNPSASEGDTRDAVLIRGSGKFPGVENGNPLQHSYLKNSMDRGALWATVHRVTKSQTRQSVHTHTHSAPGGELCTHTHTHIQPLEASSVVSLYLGHSVLGHCLSWEHH